MSQQYWGACKFLLSRYCTVGPEKIWPAMRQKRKSHGKASDYKNKRITENGACSLGLDQLVVASP